MDPRGHIYSDDEDKIPAEDTARLDGYLLARADMKRLKARREAFEAREREDDPA